MTPSGKQTDSGSAKKPPFRAVAYYRSSVQDRQEHSISVQQQQVREWAEQHGVEIIEEFADAGQSGQPDEERPAFNEMMDQWVTQRSDFDWNTVDVPMTLMTPGSEFEELLNNWSGPAYTDMWYGQHVVDENTVWHIVFGGPDPTQPHPNPNNIKQYGYHNWTDTSPDIPTSGPGANQVSSTMRNRGDSVCENCDIAGNNYFCCSAWFWRRIVGTSAGTARELNIVYPIPEIDRKEFCQGDDPDDCCQEQIGEQAAWRIPWPYAFNCPDCPAPETECIDPDEEVEENPTIYRPPKTLIASITYPTGTQGGDFFLGVAEGETIEIEMQFGDWMQTAYVNFWNFRGWLGTWFGPWGDPDDIQGPFRIGVGCSGNFRGYVDTARSECVYTSGSFDHFFGFYNVQRQCDPFFLSGSLQRITGQFGRLDIVITE